MTAQSSKLSPPCVASKALRATSGAQDEVREDREHRATRGALETPDGDPTQTDPDVMRVARQAPASATGRFVFQLQADG